MDLARTKYLASLGDADAAEAFAALARRSAGTCPGVPAACGDARSFRWGGICITLEAVPVLRGADPLELVQLSAIHSLVRGRVEAALGMSLAPLMGSGLNGPAGTPVELAAHAANSLGHACGPGGLHLSPGANLSQLQAAWSTWYALDTKCYPGQLPGIDSWMPSGEGVVHVTCTGRTRLSIRDGYARIEASAPAVAVVWEVDDDGRESVTVEAGPAWDDSRHLSREAFGCEAYRLQWADDLTEGRLSRLLGEPILGVAWRAYSAAESERYWDLASALGADGW